MYLDRARIGSKNVFPPRITFCFLFSVVPSSPYVRNLPPVSPSVLCPLLVSAGKAETIELPAGQLHRHRLRLLPGQHHGSWLQFSVTAKPQGSDMQPAWLPLAGVVGSGGEVGQWGR